MACSANSYSLLISHQLSKKALNSFTSFSFSSNCRSLLNSDDEPPPAAIKQASSNPTNLFSIQLRTLEACKLGIGRYPNFEYNSSGGGGTATGKSQGPNSADEIFAVFDIQKLYIPPLTGANTRFLGLPLPPLLKIDIAPEIFQGSINRKSGKIELQFRASFCFSLGGIYSAPPLIVETILTSEESKGSMRGGEGEKLDREGMCRLVGVAKVDPIDDVFMNSFLSLPTECIAQLNAQIFITETVKPSLSYASFDS